VIVCPLRRMITQIQGALSRMQPVLARRHLRFSSVAIGHVRPRRRA
jgi:hypothetical protein